MTPSGFHPLRIRDIRAETAEAVSIAFEVPEPLRAIFAYRPGQYLTLRTTLGGAEVRRAYSICSGLDDGELRIAVKHVADGVFSRHANRTLRTGDTIDVMPPDGRFGLAADAPAPIGGPIFGGPVLVGIAAGSGITPILAILRTMLARAPAGRFLLFYGSRTTAGILFREALEDLKDRHLGRLSVFHVLSREAQDLAVMNGRLDAAKLRALLPRVIDPAAIDHAFVCGPAGLIDDATAVLAELGLGPERVHVERFTPAEGPRPRGTPPVAADAAPFATATIIHDGIAIDVPVAADETVLDAALRAGLDLPWSCRASCAAGSVAMTQNFSLEPWETEAGFVLTCQAHPTTPHVTIDYDHV